MPLKFLVVDDEPDVELLIRHQFRRQLRAGEYEFVFAGDGEEALARLQEHEDVEIVLSDINMPRMDGLSLLVAITELNRLLKVVMVSAYGDLANIRTAMNRGAFDFVTKPIDFADLEATIEKSLRELEILRRAQALQKRMGALDRELAIARRIQLAMLPTTFPDHPGVEVHGLAIPAREVGGDLYDFVETGPHRLGFVIGDVAGKGLGAALFMAITRTVIRTAALQDLPVEECVRRVNRVMASETQHLPHVFVTMLYGVLDTRTGEVAFCNAGHNPPALVRAEPAGGPAEAVFLDAPKGLALCLADDFEFGARHLLLAPGDTLVLYTDGVTEAFDPEGEEFSEERLLQTLGLTAGTTPRALLEQVVEEVRTFARQAPQSDDLTMLALRYTGA